MIGCLSLLPIKDLFLIVLCPKKEFISEFLILVVILFIVSKPSIDKTLFAVIVPLLFMFTNIVLYWMMFVLYSVRREAMRRPIYFVGESSLDE